MSEETITIPLAEYKMLLGDASDLITFRFLTGCRTPDELCNALNEIQENNKKIQNMLNLIRSQTGAL